MYTPPLLFLLPVRFKYCPPTEDSEPIWKVFWSWQSDHPGKISRHFVREALEQAIIALKQDPNVEEAARDAELDHDRKDVPGSPDLARVILEKIEKSDVFVADVTSVGAVTDKPEKKLINANVAIELGYH